MRKGKSVIGQAVFSIADGMQVGSVKDLVLEDGEDGVVALLVSEGGLLGTSKLVPFASVIRFGPSAVMIADRSSVIPAGSDPRVSEILGRRGTLLGTRVMSDDGKDLGNIADMYFDETSGRITGYEVSGGMLGDAMRGSSYLPFGEIRTIGTDAVITAASARDVLEPHDEAGRRETPAEPVDGDPDASLVGARASSELTDRDGSVILASGQPITREMVERARSDDTLDRLYGAAGQTRPGDESIATGEALSKAADSAADLWGRFTTKLSEMTDAAGQRMDSVQTKARLDAINDAIGRPVTKVFLDRDDSVILDLGDLVTHQAVQRAEDAGLLDSLLGSVYKAPDVTFTRDEMRADIAGDSTVDKASGGASVVTDLEAKVDEATAKAGPEPSPAEPKAQNGRHADRGQPVGAAPDVPARGQPNGRRAEAATSSKDR